jgi:hypothetical protein
VFTPLAGQMAAVRRPLEENSPRQIACFEAGYGGNLGPIPCCEPHFASSPLRMSLMRRREDAEKGMPVE